MGRNISTKAQSHLAVESTTKIVQRALSSAKLRGRTKTAMQLTAVTFDDVIKHVNKIAVKSISFDEFHIFSPAKWLKNTTID